MNQTQSRDSRTPNSHPVEAEHRETIQLLIQALNSRISALDRDPTPGWWFTPPEYVIDH